MRFEVPQFIEIEDKIFGPLTWQQFIFVGGGVGLAAVLFFLTPFIVFVIFALPIGALAFMLGFFPINNRPFVVFLEAMYNYARKTRLYLWRKQGGGVYGDTRAGASTSAVPVGTGGKASNLTSLSRRLELQAIQKDI